ncbi:MAG: DoxX family protein [Pseudolabrys sp.]
MPGLTTREPKLIFPGLSGFYAKVSDLWYLMIRITVAGCLLSHGWPKLMSGAAAIAPGLAKSGFVPGIFFAYAAIILETLGAVCVGAGLFTRFFAAGIAIEMALITFVVQLPRGFARMELALIFGIVFFAIALRGGGPYSLDRVIGKEL